MEHENQEETLKIYQKIIGDLRPQLDAILGVSASISEKLEILRTIIEGRKRWLELTKKLQQDYENWQTAFNATEWWFSPALLDLPAQEITEAVRRFVEGNPSAITDFIRDSFQSENCKKLKATLDTWEQSAIFTPWKTHLDDAFAAHREKKYTLAVPVFLLIAEGVAGKFCEDNHISVNRSSGGKKIAEALKKSKEGQMSSLDLPLLVNAIEKSIYRDTNEITKDRLVEILNRHAVLHGLLPSYATEENSLKAFFLLDALSVL